MVYRVVLLSNGKYKKTLARAKTRETAFINFHRLKKNNNVYFSKRFLNTKKIKPVKFEICVTKPTEDTDTFRLLRDEYGKVYVEKPLGDWTILHSDSYEVEEKFWIYGHDSKKNRPTIKEIIKKLMVNAYSAKLVKQVIVLNNKLVIYNETDFDLILCKNIEDAQRLHHTLYKISKKHRYRHLMFMGTASPYMVGVLYKLIMEKTGWSYIKVKRVTTRP
jgi:hypothetical protein